MAKKLLKNPPFALRHAQGEGERRRNQKREGLSVRTEPVEAREYLGIDL